VIGQGVDALNQQPYQYGIIGTVVEGLDTTVQKITALANPNATDDPATQRPTKKVTIKKVTIAESPSSTAGSTAPAAPPAS
jgi:cyclophilin family peptidyl-prolyl cis-trans isomerase